MGIFEFVNLILALCAVAVAVSCLALLALGRDESVMEVEADG